MEKARNAPAGKLALARSFAYGFRADRGLKRLKTDTSGGSKSDKFRVATVRPCSSAVVMARSIPLLLTNPGNSISG
jgi:hypothetical protein